MKKLLILLITLYCIPTFAQWQNEGNAAFSPGQVSYTDLKFNGGSPFVAYRDAANANRASLMQYDGSTWNNVGIPGFSAGGATYTSLAFYNTFAHVAYVDGANSNRVSVKAFDGASWQDVGIPGFSGMNCAYVNLEFIGSTPYVAFQDGGNGSRVTVMSLQTGVWTNVGLPGFSSGVASDISLTVLGGVPYVGFIDASFSNEASVMYYNGTSWVYLGAQGFTSGGIGEIVIDTDGTDIYAAVQDLSTGQEASLFRFDGTNWVAVGPQGFSPAGVAEIDLAFDAGEPYLAFQDASNGFRGSVMNYDGVNWVYEGGQGFTSSQCVYTSIEFLAGTPYIAFQDYNGGNYNATVMKYIPCPDPDVPTVSYSATSICQGESITITIDAGNLNSATAWHLYAGGCTGTSLANSPTGPFVIYPSASATYSVRGEGGCVGFIPCIANQAVFVTPVDTAVSIVGGNLEASSVVGISYQWLDCNNAMNQWIGDTNQIFIPPWDGSYAVEITQDGCVDTSSCHGIVNVGLEDYSRGILEMYPNPASQNLNIIIPSEITDGTIQIFNLAGERIISYSFISESVINLSLEDLVPGVYLVELQNSNHLLTEKLIIH